MVRGSNGVQEMASVMNSWVLSITLTHFVVPSRRDVHIPRCLSQLRSSHQWSLQETRSHAVNRTRHRIPGHHRSKCAACFSQQRRSARMRPQHPCKEVRRADHARSLLSPADHERDLVEGLQLTQEDSTSVRSRAASQQSLDRMAGLTHSSRASADNGTQISEQLFGSRVSLCVSVQPAKCSVH
jgi:hypothetical protein